MWPGPAIRRSDNTRLRALGRLVERCEFGEEELEVGHGLERPCESPTLHCTEKAVHSVCVPTLSIVLAEHSREYPRELSLLLHWRQRNLCLTDHREIQIFLTYATLKPFEVFFTDLKCLIDVDRLTLACIEERKGYRLVTSRRNGRNARLECSSIVHAHHQAPRPHQLRSASSDRTLRDALIAGAYIWRVQLAG